MKQGKLPDDFPYVEKLNESGVTTYAQARNMELTDIEGIGPARAKEIEQALNAVESVPETEAKGVRVPYHSDDAEPESESAPPPPQRGFVPPVPVPVPRKFAPADVPQFAAQAWDAVKNSDDPSWDSCVEGHRHKFSHHAEEVLVNDKAPQEGDTQLARFEQKVAQLKAAA